MPRHQTGETDSSDSMAEGRNRSGKTVIITEERCRHIIQMISDLRMPRTRASHQCHADYTVHPNVSRF